MSITPPITPSAMLKLKPRQVKRTETGNNSTKKEVAFPVLHQDHFFLHNAQNPVLYELSNIGASGICRPHNDL